MKTRISFLALTASFALVSHGASLTENVAAVESCRVAITNAIVAKGGTASGALTNAAAEIAALPSGSGKEWWYNEQWGVDIREVLEKLPNEGYTYKSIALYPTNLRPVLNGALKYKTQDGREFSGTSEFSIDWTSDFAATNKFGWVAYLYNSEKLQMQVQTNNMVWIVIGTNSYMGVIGPDIQSMNYHITAICGRIGDGGRLWINNYLSGARSLIYVEDCRLPLAEPWMSQTALEYLGNKTWITTEPWGVFGFAEYYGKRITDKWNLLNKASSSFKASTRFFRLESLPRAIRSYYSINFAASECVIDKSSVCVFEDGNVVDSQAFPEDLILKYGLINNLPTTSASSQTLTLNSAIRGLFTEEEQSAIAAALTEKNWTLAW